MMRILMTGWRRRACGLRRRVGGAATRLPTRQRGARARSAALPSRASLQTELGGEIVDEREQDVAGGGEAVALGAALTGAASQLGGARRIVEQAPEGHAQRRRVARTNEHAAAL